MLHHYVGYVELVSQVSEVESLEFHWRFGSTGALRRRQGRKATGAKPDPDSSMPFPLTKLAGGMEFTDL